MGIDHDGIQRPVRDAGGRLSHVGHRVVGQHTHGRDRDEVVVEVVFNGRFVVKDVELKIVSSLARAVRVIKEFGEVKGNTAATLVKGIRILVAEDGPCRNPVCFVEHRINVFSIQRVVNRHPPNNIIGVVVPVVRTNRHGIDAVVNEFGGVPCCYP